MPHWQGTAYQEMSLRRGLNAEVAGVLELQTLRFIKDGDTTSGLQDASEKDGESTIDPASVRFAGSYSFLAAAQTPTILVPGKFGT
jgi:hypothetical protein